MKSYPAVPASHADDLFDAPNYSAWVARTIGARNRRSGALALFESTISEPTDALVDVIRDAFSLQVTPRYVSVFAGGNHFALEALSERYGAPAEQFVTTTGATSAMAMILKALVTPGDHVLVETPGFDLLTGLARDAGAIVDHVGRVAPSFDLDLSELQAKLTPRTRAVMLTNLHNPSGARLSPGAIATVAQQIARVGALLIVDEVYADFARDGGQRPSSTLGPNIVTVSSLTKAFGLFALKFGWMCASPVLLDRIRSRNPDGDIGVSKLSHAVAAHVLAQSEVFDLHWRKLLADNRPIVARHVQAMIAEGLLEGDLPEYGCMYFPRVVGFDDTVALARRLWLDFGLLVAPGEYFGRPGHVRLGFGSESAEIDAGYARLHNALSLLQGARVG